MANYVLGPSAARKLQEMMRGRMAAGRVDGGGAQVVDEQAFAHPFELRWAASSGEGGAGAWIIWLPPGSLVTDGTEASTADLTAAAGYPAGWYDLTSIFGESDVPESFDLFLDVGEKVKFTTDRAAATNPVLVASVTGKTVKGIVESALVATPSAPHAWELRRFYDDPETEGGEPVPVWRVWIPKAALLFVWGKLTRDVVYDSGTGESVITEPGVSAGSWGSAEYTGEVDAERTAAAVASGLAGKWVNVTPGESGELFACVAAASAATISQPTVTLTGTAPQDSTVNHPSSLTQGGIYIRIADVNSAGVVTQHLSSLAVLTVYSGGDWQKLIVGGDGITVTESNGRITISATGSGSGSGGGSDGDEGGETECVESLNGGTGAMSIVAGEGISVAVKNGVITITNTKPCECEGTGEESPAPSDPCGHPESGEEGGSGGSGSGDAVPGESGGVPAGGDGESGDGGGVVGGGGLGSGWSESGVVAGGDSHSGSNDCCTE